MECSERGYPWSKKVRCYSREAIADVCRQERVIITDEDIAHFCLYWISWTEVEAREGSSLSMATT